MTAKLTAAQAWALRAIAEGYGNAPSQLGERMMERPGASDHRNGTPYKSQGYGRMGGAMMARLKKVGLVSTWGWPTKAKLTPAGRAAMEDKR